MMFTITPVLVACLDVLLSLRLLEKIAAVRAAWARIP
jgi:hypothetical protein